MRQQKKPRRPAHLAKRAFQGLAAVVGLLIALTQLVDWMERRGATPTLLSAEFAAIETRRIELLREFIRDMDREPAPDETEELDQRGVGMVMLVRARASPERTLVIRWTVYDRTTGQPVPGARWSRIAARLRARPDTTERDIPCWVPLPARNGHFYVRLTIETHDGLVLAVTRTKVIRMTTLE